MLIRHPDGDAGVLGVDGVLGVVVPPPDAAAPQMPRAVPVWRPTRPSTASPLARWKATTARKVTPPNLPSTGPEL